MKSNNFCIEGYEENAIAQLDDIKPKSSIKIVRIEKKSKRKDFKP